MPEKELGLTNRLDSTRHYINWAIQPAELIGW